MLKTAFAMGIKLAYDEMGLTPEQMTAAQRIGGAGGGLAGAGLGGLLGHYLGGRAAESFDFDPAMAKTVGTGLGALAGGGLGGFVGSQIPQWKYQERKPEGQQQEESALGALPIAYAQEPYLGLGYGYDNYGEHGGYGDYDEYDEYGY